MSAPLSSDALYSKNFYNEVDEIIATARQRSDAQDGANITLFIAVLVRDVLSDKTWHTQLTDVLLWPDELPVVVLSDVFERYRKTDRFPNLEWWLCSLFTVPGFQAPKLSYGQHDWKCRDAMFSVLSAGCVDAAQALSTLPYPYDTHRDKMLSLAAKSGNENALEWVMRVYAQDASAANIATCTVPFAVKHGHANILLHLAKQQSDSVLRQLEDMKWLVSAAAGGHVAVMQMVRSNWPGYPMSADDVREAFFAAAKNDHVEAMQWLERLPTSHGGGCVPAFVNDAFITAAQAGAVASLQWLADVFSDEDLDMHAENDKAYRMAVRCGKTKAVEWLDSRFRLVGSAAKRSKKN